MNIAVIVPGGIADTLQATPLLRTLRAGVPEAHITLLSSPESLPVTRGISAPDATVAVPGLVEPAGLAATWRLWLQLRRQRFDAGLLCAGDWRLRAAMFFAGLPRRLGPGGGSSAMLLTGRSAAVAGQNRATTWLRIARLAGIRQELHGPEFDPGPEARREAERLINLSGLGDGRLLVALAPGVGLSGVNPPRPDLAWDAERFALLANLLAARHGAGILFLGALSDRPVIEQTMLDLGTGVVDLSGQPDIRVLAGLLARCDLVVSADTFLVHLAAAVGTASVGLYGPTDGRTRGPYGADHRIIQAVPQQPRTAAGMDQIRVEDVLASIEASL